MRLNLVMLAALLASCDRPPAENSAAPSPTGPEWKCDDDGGEMFFAGGGGGHVVVVISVETGEMSEVARSRGLVRSVAVAGRTVYWNDDEGIHSRDLGAPNVRDLVKSRDVDRIASDGRWLVYSDEVELKALHLSGGESRRLATLDGRYQDHQHIVVTSGAAYWGNVHLRGNVRVPDQDSLWTVGLEAGARPVRIASLDMVDGFCIGPGGRVVWLDGGPGPAFRPPDQDSDRTTRVMQVGGPLAEVKARSTGMLVATETGFAFTTAEKGTMERTIWHVTLKGQLTKLRPRLPDEGTRLRVEKDAVVVLDLDGKIRRLPTRE